MLGWGKRQTKRKVKCSAGANVKPKGKLNAPPGLPVGDDKKCKKKLSFDAVALSGGFFYPELRSTIVRVALPSFALLVIKGVLKALPSREWHGRPCRQSSPSPIRYEFFIFQLGQSKSLSISEPPAVSLLWGVRVCCS